MEKLDGKSLDLVKTNIEALKQLFPEVVTEGKIDFEKLKLVLGEEIEKRNERYEFTWHGKTQAMKLAQTPSTGTLRLDKESSKNWDETENLYFEGDNLEVLKLLQKSYFGKIKMIYIDPPYNTGKDFVYKDDFHDNIKNYKEMTRQTTKANSETNGRFHTDWLNMMYPRLKLARNLLREDGVILISINDSEITNLKKLCEEIFGEENHICDFVWQNKKGGGNDSKFIAVEHEYIVMFAKNLNVLPPFFEAYSEEYLKRYKEEDEKGKFYWDTFKRKSGKQYYPITCPDGTVLEYDEYGNKISWLRSQDRFYKDLEEGEIRFVKTENGWSVQFKQRLPKGKKPRSILDDKGNTSTGAEEVFNLFNRHVFSNPKPVELIKYFIEFLTDDNDIILDFFSGSATTAHSVILSNAKSTSRKNKFILVQLPEILKENDEAYKAGYKNICEIGKERIRRAGDKIVEETGKTDLDIGFKVFKLDSSNVKTWDPDFDNLEQTLFDLQDNIKEDRTKEDLLYEILLKIGLPLTTPIEEIDYNGKTIYNVGFGSVLLCLEDEIDLDIVNEMMKHQSEHMTPKVIFKESGFINDSVKTNAIQTLKKNGITDVRSV